MGCFLSFFSKTLCSGKRVFLVEWRERMRVCAFAGWKGRNGDISPGQGGGRRLWVSQATRQHGFQFCASLQCNEKTPGVWTGKLKEIVIWPLAPGSCQHNTESPARIWHGILEPIFLQKACGLEQHGQKQPPWQTGGKNLLDFPRGPWTFNND